MVDGHKSLASLSVVHSKIDICMLSDGSPGDIHVHVQDIIVEDNVRFYEINRSDVQMIPTELNSRNFSLITTTGSPGIFYVNDAL